MDQEQARAYAENWAQEWNDRDLEAVLGHFTEDVVFSSPVAARLLGTGTVQGKDALRAYWQKGLASAVDLRFEVVETFVGIDILVITYRNERGQMVSEVLKFRDDLVCEGYGTYAPGPAV